MSGNSLISHWLGVQSRRPPPTSGAKFIREKVPSLPEFLSDMAAQRRSPDVPSSLLLYQSIKQNSGKWSADFIASLLQRGQIQVAMCEKKTERSGRLLGPRQEGTWSCKISGTIVCPRNLTAPGPSCVPSNPYSSHPGSL